MQKNKTKVNLGGISRTSLAPLYVRVRISNLDSRLPVMSLVILDSALAIGGISLLK
jgi:hypothetical protein